MSPSDEVAEVASSHQTQIVDMLSDLSKFKDTIYTQHLTFSLSSPESALSATRNVQNVKESLDAWRENVKSRLDAVDLLCRESADTMTPEQFAQLREQRNQLAANYDNVVRTVEGVYERLNVIASLLVEFSSQTSSMQSWMTDRTRVAGSLKALSVDPDSLAKATQEARDLIDEVSREESRLKTIGYTVSSIEREIDALYTEAPSIPDRNINSDDVRTTMYRVQDDYSELMKQCQDLLQFQNRVDSLRGDSDQTLRKLDDWLASIESNITDIDDSNQIHVADKVQMLDELNKKASDEDGRLAQAEQATLRWLAAVEGSGVSEEIRRKQQDGVHSRRKRHADALDLLQQRMNSATAELAANEGARDAVARLASWSEEFEKKVRQPTVLPLREDALNELKSSEQQMRSDLERHLAVVDQLETDVAKLPASEELQNTLEESRKRLQRSGSELRGLRDNVNDALSGLQSLMLGGESLSRNCDIVAANLAGITARDATRLEASSADVGLLKSQFEQMNQTAQSLKNIPNATDAERVDLMVAAAGRRVGALASELEQKKHNMETVGRLENQFDDMKERLLEWMGRFDGDLMELGPVSVLRPRLAEQRKQCAAMADRHRQGQPQLEELEQLSMQIAESEPAGGRASSIPRHALDLLSRFKAQEDTLRSRADKINRNEQRAAEVDDAHADLNKWIEAQEKLLAEQSVPLTKEAVQTAVAKLDRIDKNTRQEQRRVEEARLKSRELARSASMEQESAAVNAVNDAVDERWNQLNDNLEASRLAARKAEHLVDGCGQLDKWLGAKGRMLEIMGAPSTEPALARSQIAQLQIIQAEAENEKPTLERLNSIAKEIESAAGPDSAAELVKRMDDLNRKWSSLEEGLAHKEDTVKKADQLGKDIKQLQKDIKREIGDLESGIESAAAMSPSEVDKQLAALDKLKQRFSGLDGMLSDLDQKVVAAEELEVDPASRSEINEQVDQAKKRADELDHKVDNVKRAALSAKDEGDALDHQIDALLSVAREVESEIHQAPPVSADPQRLSEQSAAVEAIYKTLQAKEGDVSLVKAKASDQLKKQHDSVLKAKLDELNKTWTPLLSATKDRRNNLNKISDLVKQFNDMESTLSDRLKEDEKEMESIIAEGDKAAVSDALRSMDTVLGRRLADGEALSGLCARIETAAPGPDANKLRRKADNLVDDCKRMTKKAKSVAAASQKKIDLSDKFDRLLDEARQYAAVQSAELADGADAMNKDRVHAKIGEVESFWARKNREIRTCSEQLKTVSDDAENENIDSSISEVAAEFDSLLAALRAQDALLGEKQSAADRTKEHTNKLSNDVNALYAEISDLEPVARSHDALSAQLSECAGLADSIRQQEEEAKAVEAEWQKALDDDVISQPQWEANRTALDNIDKLLARAHKKLAQRSKKIEQTEAEVSKIDSDAAALSAELDLLRSSEALSSPLDVSDPRTQAELLKQLKEAVKPVGQKVDNFQSECKVLIKSAGPDIDTTELDADLAKVSDSWSSVAAAIAEREMAVDSAVQQMGRYEDAHKALLNWLEETEEMLENQRPPSADAKVAKAQLHAYDVLLKHIEDKEASVKGFTAMIEKIAEMAPSAEEKAALRQKEAGVVKRYSDLLAGAQDRQSRLMEAVDLAERLTEGTVPLTNWLGKAEKRLQGLSNVAADAERMMAQLEAQRQLEEEVYAKGEDVDIVLAIVPMLCALVSVEDANALESQTNQLATRYESLANRTRQMKDLLADVAGQVGDFEHDTNALSEWLDEMEARMLDMDELAIEPDDLLEQSNILTDLAVIVTERDALVSGVLSVGRELSKQTSADEAIALQNRVESLKMRYADMLSVADEKLALLSKALPLSERFHDGFDDVMQWVEAVEEDLLHVDEADIETQAQLIFTMEEDVTRWRPEVEELVAVSNQLQTLSGPERADELYQNTVEMNKRVNQIADKVSRRAERLDLTEKQSRAVLDELEYIVEWLADARERVVMAGPPSIDPEFVKTQLKNQRIMNEDVTANKGRLREVIAEAKKVIRQIGTDGPDSAAGYAQLEEKCELGKDLVDEVASLCMDRTECLERALVLAQQLTAEFEELSNWLDDVDNQLRNSDEITTVTPAAELRKMHEHNLELMASIVAYKPIVDRFEMNVRMMQEVCSDHEAEKLGELAEEVVGKYNDIKDAARSRGQALDGMLDATSGFAERLDNFVQNLQGAADRLRGNDSISADPVVLQNRLAENQAIIDTLRTKEAAYATLKDSAAELLAAAPHGDLAAQDVSGKLDHLEKLWRDILGEAAQRGDFLENVLAKANHFWKELDQCQKAVDDLRVRLDVVEPATGQPEQLQLQQVVLSEVAGDMSSTAPRIAALRQAGEALTAVIPPEEQVMVNTQMDAVQDGWSTITKLFADKNRDLIAAMEDAMSFHGDLAAILAWLDGAEKHVTTFTPVDILKVEEIPAQLEELFRFKAVVDEQGVLKEQLAQTASQLAAGAPAHQAAAVRQPVSEVNARWARLYGTITDREHKMEKALLQMGHLSEAADQLIAWIDRTGGTLSELTVAGPRNLRAIEIQMCKVAVIRNDVHAHEPSVAALNAAAQRLLKEESNSDTAGKIDRMNEKWRELLKTVDSLATHMETAKSEAENVGGELERWLSWLEDVEVQLATTRPTGGLPETAETQMDDFRVLRAEVEQNGGALDAYIRETERYLMEHGNDKESWVGRSHTQMKTKWNKVKELCVDREKKLQLALQEALSLHASMTATKDWVDMADEKLVNMPPVSRLLEVVEKQIVDHQQWQEEVAERKQLMAEQQAAGTRLQYYCVKSDAIPIKNGLVSLKHRFEKIASRTTERAKQLNIACDEARVWVNGIESLEEWMGQVEGGLAEQPAATSSVSKLKEQLEAVKELHQELAIRQPQFEMTRKRGVALAEHSRAPDAKVINNRNNDMVRRWTALSSMTVERQRAAEQAVLEGDAFEEAMLELEQWVDSELDRINTLDNDKVGGDVDTVRDLKDDEKKFAVERKAKKQGVDTVLRKAKDLADRRVEESASVVAAADRLRDKWSRIEEGVAKRGEALDKAAEEAADFDGKAHAMLDWLTVTENKLKGPTTDISAALAAVNAAKADLDENREKKDSCLAKGREIQGRCHPRADQPLKHWLRVVENRWKEVEERAAEREFSLLEEEQKEQERAESLKQLQKFVAAKKDQLARMTSQPAADDLEILDVMQKEHEEFDAALREKQPDVDAATKGIKKGVRNPAADQLSSEWKQLWLDSLGHQSAMDSQKALLEEMKRLEGWKWEDWKERYVEFNDHGKARVSDLFRRIGRSTTGKVPRDVFIDAIIHSKFPTSRLEMAKVADLFDKGDRMIDSKQFINALRFDMANRTREPVTDHEKINEEIVKQKNSCSCCQQYKIEKISEGHYRFGDTQIKRMVRILRSTVMVRVGGGWEALDEFLSKHDPCRAKGRLNINMFHKDAAPSNAIDTMRAFTKGRHQRVPTTGTPGPIMKIREKTERSLPMFPSSPSSSSLSNRRDRAPSDVSLADSRFGRPSMSNSRSSLLDGGSRPPSRTGSEADSDRPTRIPSLRGKKGTRYNPPSANK